MHILLIQQKKSSIDGGIFAFAYAIETLHGESVENLSFGVTLMSKHLVIYLQLENVRYFRRPLSEVQQIVTNFTNHLITNSRFALERQINKISTFSARDL